MAVFVDTGAWVALANRKDGYHAAASSHLGKLLAQKTLLVTTSLVVAETVTRIRYDLGHPAAEKFLTLLDGAVEARHLVFVRVTEEDEERAREIFLKYTDHLFSFVDCTSFAVMRRMGLKEVFGFDRDFAAMGYLLQPAVPG
jgi:predicted nucleic acid-binding protein